MSRMISHVYDHLFSRGWSGGYARYRYSDEGSKIYNPAKQPRLARQYLNGGIVAEVVEILRDVPADTSAWAREGETRTGLRRGLLSDGADLSWREADDTAAEIIRRAFSVLRVSSRPAWDAGQRYATLDERQCIWCSRPLEHDGRYCSAEHARLALDHFDYETNYGASPVGRAAYRVIRRDREEARTCELEGCGQTFKPMSSDSTQRYCCKAHAYQAMRLVLPERDCQYCGAPFQPNEPEQRYCNQAHATAALRKDNEKPCANCGEPFKPHHGDNPTRDKYCSTDCANEARQIPKHPRVCLWCGDDFLGKTRVARFCCDAHSQAHRKATRGHLPAMLTAPAFDYIFTAAAAA